MADFATDDVYADFDNSNLLTIRYWMMSPAELINEINSETETITNTCSPSRRVCAEVRLGVLYQLLREKQPGIIA